MAFFVGYARTRFFFADGAGEGTGGWAGWSKYPRGLSHSRKIFTTRDDNGRSSSAAAFSRAAFKAGSTRNPRGIKGAVTGFFIFLPSLQLTL
jgi:hypothetical protein